MFKVNSKDAGTQTFFCCFLLLTLSGFLRVSLSESVPAICP